MTALSDIFSHRELISQNPPLLMAYSLAIAFEKSIIGNPAASTSLFMTSLFTGDCFCKLRSSREIVRIGSALVEALEFAPYSEIRVCPF